MNSEAVADLVAARIAEAVAEKVASVFAAAMTEMLQRFAARQSEDELLTTDELARALKVSRATVKRYAGKGMPVERVGERCPRYRLAACLAWHRELKQRPQTSAATRPTTGIRRLSR